MRQSMRPIVLSFLLCVLAACGGNEDGVGQVGSGFTVQGGVAQKGPLLKGSHVWIDELNPLTYAPSGYTYDLLTKDNQGRFDSSAINFTRQHIQTFAEGYYFNEITGVMANDSVLLQAQGDLTLDRLVNVNLLTTLAGPRLVALVTDKAKTSTYRKFSAARAQAQKEVLAAFWIYNSTDLLPGGVDATQKLVPANFSELDLSNNQSANQILAALSALAVKAGGNGVGISQGIANFQQDLADDGLINGSGGATSVRSMIDAASATVGLMTTVATNLNAFYGANTINAAQLTPWVDSSGGVDRVIDKYKFSASNVAANSESKSPVYVAGPDDVGQCFSVGGVTGSVASKLYYKNSATAVTGAQRVNLGDTVSIGLTANSVGSFSGFIQRSPPSAGGACPAAPTTALTRVLKYTITVSQETSPSCGATNAINSVTTFAGYIPPNVDCILYKDGIYLNAGFLDGLASAARFNNPNGIAFDGGGSLYIADTYNNAVRKVSADGVVSTVAGTGVSGASNGNASTATFNRPTSVALDDSGNVYVADSGNNLIRKISVNPGGSSASTGTIISTVAGSGVAGFANGAGAQASFNNPVALVYFNKTLYVADRNNNSIRSINPVTGVVATLAGSGAQGELDGLGTAAKFNLPNSMAVDATGTLYVTTESAAIYQGYAGAVRKVSPSGNVTTLIISRGSGPPYPAGVVADQYFYTLNGIAVAPTGDVYVATMFQIFKINPAGTVASNYAGFYNVNYLPWSMVRNGPLKTAMFDLTMGGLAFDSKGNLYVADTINNLIRKILSPTQIITVAD